LFDGIAENEYMYLVHSFLCSICAEAIAITNYEVECISFAKDNFTEPSFTLKKSGDVGEKILGNFLKL
jgi:glutamine amidotransferase